MPTPFNTNKNNSTDDSLNNASKVEKKALFDPTIFAVDFTKATKRFWYIVVAFALIGGLAFGFLTYVSYTPMYQSSVSFSVAAVSHNSSGNAVFASYYDNSTAAQLSKTFPYIVNTSMMKNALKNELDTNFINGTITASSVASDSNIFKVTVSSNSAKDAFDIVNAVIEVYPDVASFVVGNVRLNILIKPALIDEPYTTNNFLRVGAIMSLIGATCGFGLIAVYALFRNTVRKKEDFKNKLNQKCYVEIPQVIFYRTSNDKKLKDRLVRITDRHPTFKEAFRLLRKRLLRNLNSDEKVIAITSAASGEGKTMVALNLAHSIAISGKKTACVDFDLNSRSLQRYFSQPDFKGFTDILADSEPDFDSVIYTDIDNLDIFFPGNSRLDFTEADYIIFFNYLRNKYDYVIVNIAPAREIANSLSISNLCDCTLFTVYQDRLSIDKIRKAIETMSFSSARILGFVFNGVQEGFSGYGGYYYGGKYGYSPYGRYGYGKYGYSRYGYSKYGYGADRDNTDKKDKEKSSQKHKRHKKHHPYGYGYGYGKGYGHSYGYGYGYGYGEDEDDSDYTSEPTITNDTSLFDIADDDIPVIPN